MGYFSVAAERLEGSFRLDTFQNIRKHCHNSGDKRLNPFAAEGKGPPTRRIRAAWGYIGLEKTPSQNTQLNPTILFERAFPFRPRQKRKPSVCTDKANKPARFSRRQRPQP